MVDSSLGWSGVCVEIKVDSSSVKFYRGPVGMPTLGAYSVAVAAVVLRDFVLISGMR